MLYSPRWLFLYPGLLLMLAGGLVGLWLLPGPEVIAGISLDVHTLLYAALAVIAGFQAVIFATFTKVFAISEGLLPHDPRVHSFSRSVTLEKGLVTGATVLLLGIAGTIYAFSSWGARSFGVLDPSETLRTVIPSVTAIALGFEVMLSSLFLSVLSLKRK